jgi:hypothetical protein
MRIFRVFKKNVEIYLQIMARPILDRKIDHDDWWISQNITILSNYIKSYIDGFYYASIF